jgi:endonuclease YncB( thermonuclease family)
MRVYRYSKPHRVIDGDTVIFDIDLGFGVRTHQTIRLNNVDTFELRGGSSQTKRLAQLEKEKLIEILGKENCELHVYKRGKYGRWIADIFNNEGSLANLEINMFHQKIIKEEKN